MNKTVSILGSGFSSVAAACYLAQGGYEVHVYEKNSQLGGRASQYKQDGFIFDMGPTWYWMPDVFERFFADFGKKPSDYYQLERLDPGYRVYFDKDDYVNIQSDLEDIYKLFELEQKGSSKYLKEFLDQAKSNYQIAVQDLVYKPGVSPLELVSKESIFKLNQLFTNIKSQIDKKFTNPRLRKILEFPVLFLGAKPSNTPQMYNFMNWADFGLGTWHPVGGMYSVVDGMVNLAESLGVQFNVNAEVSKIEVDSKGVSKGVVVNGDLVKSDFILSGADYHHTESLLNKENRQYSEKYWDSKTFAPSALLFYVGFDKKIENVEHHTLFFDEEFDRHAEFIYDDPSWPEDPLFYASFPSITDDKFAPSGKEAATFLVPIAVDIEDTDEIRNKYFDIIMDRLSNLTNQDIRKHVLFTKSYCVNDFKEDYNSYKGNAYGLANTLTQTAFLRPKLKSKKVKNLYFSGQLTVPGPGVPPALISGKLSAELILNLRN